MSDILTHSLIVMMLFFVLILLPDKFIYYNNNNSNNIHFGMEIKFNRCIIEFNFKPLIVLAIDLIHYFNISQLIFTMGSIIYVLNLINCRDKN